MQKGVLKLMTGLKARQKSDIFKIIFRITFGKSILCFIVHTRTLISCHVRVFSTHLYQVPRLGINGAYFHSLHIPL